MGFKFGLDEIVKDEVTGFEGCVTARCDYISGPNRYELTKMHSPDDIKAYWFDESRLKEV